MTACDRMVDPQSYKDHRPIDYDTALGIMAHIAKMSPQEIAGHSGLSGSMSLKLHRMSLEFPNENVGQQAIDAYTGVVFKALDYSTLSEADRSQMCRNVRIISSLYGWLRPDDIIKAYRMDYTSRLSPNDKAMYAFWRDRVSANLAAECQSSGCNEILNLLPGDAEKCVDWKLVKRYANVWKVDFKQLKDGGTFATPHAGQLKTLRGHLLREIAKQHIETPTDLLALSTELLLPMGASDRPDHITFCV